MPTGDTLHELAAWLAPRLEGRGRAGLWLRDDPTVDRRGALVESVRARGKHLFVHLEDGWSLRTHLGMHGSWHVYARGEAWRLAERRAAAVFASEDAVYVCFDAAEVELARTAGPRTRRVERHLGPDLTAEAEPDLDALPARARETLPPEAPLVDLLLDQRIACGIGTDRAGEDDPGSLGGAALRAGARSVVLSRENLPYRFAETFCASLLTTVGTGASPAEAARRARAEVSAENSRWLSLAAGMRVLGNGGH